MLRLRIIPIVDSNVSRYIASILHREGRRFETSIAHHSEIITGIVLRGYVK